MKFDDIKVGAVLYRAEDQPFVAEVKVHSYVVTATSRDAIEVDDSDANDSAMRDTRFLRLHVESGTVHESPRAALLAYQKVHRGLIDHAERSLARHRRLVMIADAELAKLDGVTDAQLAVLEGGS